MAAEGLHPTLGVSSSMKRALRGVGSGILSSLDLDLTRRMTIALLNSETLVVVRKVYVGYERYDCQEAVTVMNELTTYYGCISTSSNRHFNSKEREASDGCKAGNKQLNL